MSLSLQLSIINQTNPLCRFRVEVENQGQPLGSSSEPCSLHFTFDRFVHTDSIQITSGPEHDFRFKQIGSYCVLSYHAPISAERPLVFEFDTNTAPMRFLSNNFIDAFATVGIDAPSDKLHNIELKPIQLATPYTQRSHVPEVEAASVGLIPKPNQLELHNEHWILPKSVTVSHSDERSLAPFKWLEQESRYLGLSFNAQYKKAQLRFESLEPGNDESYQLHVDQSGITLRAASTQGFFHAVASLLQLLPTQSGAIITLPCLTIFDSPTYRQRGFMLDCARHFHSIDTVKQQINQCARYKLNTFHWHLTDDEGWRIEIKRFPQLTEIGAWRGLNEQLEPQFTSTTVRHGGFYTQQQIREVIEYASSRGVTIIPEIDVPGHCRAAIRSLPELLIEQQDQSVYRSIQNYTDNVLNPGIPGTYEFLDAVLEEVAALFPAHAVHIGADEVPQGVWEQSPGCQKLIKQHGYQEASELQGHLLRHAEDKLASLGKRMLGWEEAQHGDKVSKNTVIYSWLSEKAGLECAKMGFDVVLQPAQFTYLDLTQDYAPQEIGVDWAGVLPLEVAYSYQPLAELAEDDPLRQRIVGIQCALWCELVNNPQRLQFMVYPRLQAIAEAAWTAPSKRQWPDFLARLKLELEHLDRQGINYRDPWQTH